MAVLMPLLGIAGDVETEGKQSLALRASLLA